MVFSGRKFGQYADQELLKSLLQNKTPDLSLKYILITRVSRNKKGKQANRKNSIKKQILNRKKTLQTNRKQRRREPGI